MDYELAFSLELVIEFTLGIMLEKILTFLSIYFSVIFHQSSCFKGRERREGLFEKRRAKKSRELDLIYSS